jgi:hypothetical protein
VPWRAVYPLVLPSILNITRNRNIAANQNGMKYSFRSRSRLAWLFLQLNKLYVKIVIHGSLFLVGASFLIADPPSTLVDPKDTKGISFVQPSVALREDVTLSCSVEKPFLCGYPLTIEGVGQHLEGGFLEEVGGFARE